MGLMETAIPASAALLTSKRQPQATPANTPALTSTEVGFCGFSVATAVAMGLTESSPIILKNEAKLVAPVYAQVLDPVDAIKKKEAEFGNRPLLITDAKEIVKLSNEMLAQRKDGVFSDPRFFQNPTYVLSGGPNFNREAYANTEPLKHPVVLNHYQNYPDYPYSEIDAQMLIQIYNDPYFGQVSWGSHRAMINLDNVNTRTSSNPDYSPNPYQFLGTGSQPIRMPITPITAFRSVKQHEDFHHDGDSDGMRPVDPEIVTFLKRQGVKISDEEFPGLIANFSVNVSTEDGTLQENTKFNEMVTDHQGIRISQEAGLPWWIAYQRQPVDHFNLKAIFDQSGISFAELNRMYKKHLLVEFYSRIAEGAAGKLFTPSSDIQDKFDFAVHRLPWWDFPVWNPKPEDNKPNIIIPFPGIILPKAA